MASLGRVVVGNGFWRLGNVRGVGLVWGGENACWPFLQPVPSSRRYAATRIGRHEFAIFHGLGRASTIDIKPSTDRHQRSAVAVCCLSGMIQLSVHAPGDLARRHMRNGHVVTVRTPPDCAGGFVHQELVLDLIKESLVCSMSFVMAPPEGRPDKEPWVSPTTKQIVSMPELTNDQESHICYLLGGLGPGGEDDTACVFFSGRGAFELLEPLAPQDGYLITCIQGSVDVNIADPSDEASPVRYRLGGPEAEKEGAANPEGGINATIAFYFVPGSVITPGPEEIVFDSGERKKAQTAAVLIRGVQCSDLGLD